MGESTDSAARPTKKELLGCLIAARNRAADRYFQHQNPGGLTPAEQQAWQMEERALGLLVKAAQIRLDAELEIQELLTVEYA